MGFIFAAVSWAVAAAVTTVAAVAVTVASIIASVVAAVTATIGPIISGIGQVVGNAVAVVTENVLAATEAISTAIQSAIEVVMNGISNLTQPILEPIKDTLVVLDKMTASINTYVTTTLEPVMALIETAEKVSGLFMVVNLLKGAESVTDVMRIVAYQNGVQTARAIAILYNQIVRTAYDTMQLIQDTAATFNSRVIHAEERIRESNEQALEELRGRIKEQQIRMEGALLGRTHFFERRVDAVAKKTEDLAWFGDMMVKVLE